VPLDGRHRLGGQTAARAPERLGAAPRAGGLLSNLPADAPLARLVGLIKARWVCEQAHQQMKEELGLDHFEGRSWHGLHHHALMVMVAMAFLQHLRLAEHHRAGPGKNAPPRSGAATAAEPARRPRRPRRPAARAA
jgi:SRSO17 transposase